tara:strand:+ start:421 stop:996 length:576 start_codon:yes stop_codon:yes gene_type:complete
MANKDAAFGLKAIGKVGQNRDNQGLSEYSISANASAIFQNDPVRMLATGTIGVADVSAITLLGSLNGVFYTDASTSKPTWSNHLEASNTATDIVGFVADDPYERFEVQSDNAGASAQADIGQCADIVYADGAAPNYISKVELDDGTFVTSSAQLKVVGVSKDPENNDLGSANVNFVVTINEHFLKQVSGTA